MSAKISAGCPWKLRTMSITDITAVTDQYVRQRQAQRDCTKSLPLMTLSCNSRACPLQLQVWPWGSLALTDGTMINLMPAEMQSFREKACF